MHSLVAQLHERVAAGLRRAAVKSCSRWAQEYRVMGQPYPGKWDFKHHPWLKMMHDIDAELIVGQKAAQMGYTETVLNRCLCNIDIRGISCLYILPTQHPDATDFSASRFDPALELSDHLSNMFTDTKNTGHKRAGSANLFVRGSKSRNQLKSVPAGFIVIDELDECDQDNISLALERQSGQVIRQTFMISTPTVEDVGINFHFKSSTQRHYFFVCPYCSRMIELEYPGSFVLCGDGLTDPRIKESHIICNQCKHKLNHEDKIIFLQDGEQVAQYPGRDIEGFYINQLYSMPLPPWKIAELIFKAQVNEADEQELYNSKFGLAHCVKGARVTDLDIKNCIGDHLKVTEYKKDRLITAGIDIGGWIHITFEEWLPDNRGLGNDMNLCFKPKVLLDIKVREFEDIDDLILRMKCKFFVVDAQPERRKALELVKRFPMMSRRCFFVDSVSGKEVTGGDDPETISVNRTSWLDLALGRFRKQAISLPLDISYEYKDHQKALAKHYKKNDRGEVVAQFVKGVHAADHFAMTRLYNEVALSLAVSALKSEDM